MLRAQQGPGSASGRKVRENQMVSMSKLVVMGLLAVLTAAVPIGVMSYLRRRGGRWRDFLVGAGTFFLFAMVLESLVHQVVLTGPLGSAIQGNIWIFGLYSGLMAGLFEEVGRFTAFKLVLRRRRDKSFIVGAYRPVYQEDTMTQAEFDQKMDDYLSRVASQPASAWAQEFLAQAQKEGITDGTRPQSFATREEVATMLLNLRK